LQARDTYGRSQGIARLVPDRRTLAYGAIGLLILAPVIAFVILGLQADSSEAALKGAGGPALAYSAGVLSFTSPCVLPIVPIYLANLAGATVEQGTVVVDRRAVITQAIAFLVGLTVVFVALGASAGLIGFVLLDNQSTLELWAGIFMVVMGALIIPGAPRFEPMRSALYLALIAAAFFFIVEIADIRDERGRVLLLAGAMMVAWLKLSGIVQFSLLSRTIQLDVGERRQVGYVRSGLIGASFATGWTPCVGPILGTILGIAATSGEGLTGAYLLSAYSLGFAMPFMLTAVAFSDATATIRRVQRFLPWIEVISALMLIGIGLLLITGRLTALNEYFNFGIFADNQGL
jgi:cytochrome c-type biogenesis protein